MKTKTWGPGRAGRQAFTLIELMVVVAIIAVMIGAVFQLMSSISQHNAEAQTKARMQRIQNAISGFYAEYGYYPPVSKDRSTDPWDPNLRDDFDDPITGKDAEEIFRKKCTFVAGSQSVDFEYPPAKFWDPAINFQFQSNGVQGPNSLFGPTAGTIKDEEWGKVKFFRFGLLSFLLPRVEVTGFDASKDNNNEREPEIGFFESRQWMKINPGSDINGTRARLAAQQAIENRTVARWLPNLEGIVYNGETILGINTQQGGSGGQGNNYTLNKSENRTPYKYNSQKYVLSFMSLRDGWGRSFFYYSAPPYQSYRLWSSGQDGWTFPPWIPLNTMQGSERKWAADSIADDIVRGEK